MTTIELVTSAQEALEGIREYIDKHGEDITVALQVGQLQAYLKVLQAQVQEDPPIGALMATEWAPVMSEVLPFSDREEETA